jgi:platelet-activating factor acetylhydrolase
MTALPSYSGPYSVGSMEIEVPVRDPRSFSHSPRPQKTSQIKTVLFSLYYPCHSVPRQAHFVAGHRKSSRPTWLPHPRFEVGKSYARFAGFRKWPTVAFLAGTTMSTKLPVHRNARLADYLAPDQDSKTPAGRPETLVFSLIIFSHGLEGIKILSSTIGAHPDASQV